MSTPLRNAPTAVGYDSTFRLELEGFDPFPVQEVDEPDTDFEMDSVATEVSEVKFQTGVKYGDMKIRFVEAATEANPKVDQWLGATVDPEEGTLAPPTEVKRDGELVVLDPAGNEVRRYIVKGAQSKQRPGRKWSKKSKKILMHEAVLAVDAYYLKV